MGQIYGIRHCKSGKMYVGSSVQPAVRQKQHFCDLRDGRHYNKHLQCAFSKHGEDSFEWVVLEDFVQDSNLAVREKYWILEMSAADGVHGYNGTSEPYAPMRGKKHSDSTIRKLCDSSRKGENHPSSKYTEDIVRQVVDLYQDGWTGKEIEMQLGIDQTNISLILSGKAWRHLGLVKTKPPRMSKSGKRGVYRTMNNKWMAEITVNKQRIHLGTHESFEKAVQAREEAERRHCGI